jgi:hypothetical protein
MVGCSVNIQGVSKIHSITSGMSSSYVDNKNSKGKKVKISLCQAMEAHRVARG